MPASMIVLIAMTVVVAIIAVYRWIVAHKEDDFLHLDARAGEVIANQRSVTRSLSQVDRIGIGLTIATVFTRRARRDVPVCRTSLDT